jgi:hypothetical protein
MARPRSASTQRQRHRPDNVDRLLAACGAFVPTLFRLPERGRMAGSLDSVINGPIFELFAQRPLH